jgi:hypothetical protein
MSLEHLPTLTEVPFLLSKDTAIIRQAFEKDYTFRKLCYLLANFGKRIFFFFVVDTIFFLQVYQILRNF